MYAANSIFCSDPCFPLCTSLYRSFMYFTLLSNRFPLYPMCSFMNRPLKKSRKNLKQNYRLSSAVNRTVYSFCPVIALNSPFWNLARSAFSAHRFCIHQYTLRSLPIKMLSGIPKIILSPSSPLSTLGSMIDTQHNLDMIYSSASSMLPNGITSTLNLEFPFPASLHVVS